MKIQRLSTVPLVLLLCSCTPRHELATEWGRVSSYGSVSAVEFMDGSDAEDGQRIDLRAFLAADFHADELKFQRIDESPGGDRLTLTIEATNVGADRSSLLAELPAVLSAGAEQQRAMGELLISLGRALLKLAANTALPGAGAGVPP